MKRSFLGILICFIHFSLFSQNINQLTIKDFEIVDNSGQMIIGLLHDFSSFKKSNPDFTLSIIQNSHGETYEINEEFDYFIYDYTDFETGTFRDQSIIRYIIIKTDKYKTKRGISVGMSSQSLVVNYPKINSQFKDFPSISHYIDENGEEVQLKIYFQTENGIIKKIIIKINEFWEY